MQNWHQGYQVRMGHTAQMQWQSIVNFKTEQWMIRGNQDGQVAHHTTFILGFQGGMATGGHTLSGLRKVGWSGYWQAQEVREAHQLE